MSDRHEEHRDLLRAVGSVIALRRTELDLSTTEFAEHCGLHRTYLGSIERGERNPTLITLDCIADFLEWRLSELLARAGY